QGEKLRQGIDRIAARSPHVKKMSGRGLFIGIEVTNQKAMAFCHRLVDLGLIINDSRGHTIRVSPPLNISDDEIDFLVARLEKVLL
nr:aminotransferase class III-fold pyridoxal phosphate-dependent enzyme [Desulfobacterales bacterium]